jgi:hypothetical protein
VAYPHSKPNGAPDPKRWARWEAGYGGIDDEIAAYGDNLNQLRGIHIDYGTYDNYTWIPDGCEYLARQLTAAGIAHRLTTFDGGHGGVGTRAEEVMIPFFAETLSTDSG